MFSMNSNLEKVREQLITEAWIGFNETHIIV